MRVGFHIGDEEPKGDDEHERAGDVHRQVGERDHRQHRGDAADHAGQDRARRRQLSDDSVGGEQEQKRGDRGVDERAEEDLPEGHWVVGDDRVACVDGQRAGRPGDGAVVERREQRGNVVGFQVGDVQPNRLLGADVHAVPHGVLGPVGIAAVHRGEGANARDRVVQDLGAEITRQIGAGGVDGMRGADIGPWGHGHHVCGLRDEQPGRSCARPAGVDVDDDRHFRIEKRRDDVVHRGRDAAGGVQHEQERARPVGLGAGHLARDIGRGDVVDVPVEVGPQDLRRGRQRWARQQGQHRRERQRDPDHTHATIIRRMDVKRGTSPRIPLPQG